MPNSLYSQFASSIIWCSAIASHSSSNHWLLTKSYPFAASAMENMNPSPIPHWIYFNLHSSAKQRNSTSYSWSTTSLEEQRKSSLFTYLFIGKYLPPKVKCPIWFNTFNKQWLSGNVYWPKCRSTISSIDIKYHSITALSNWFTLSV